MEIFLPYLITPTLGLLRNYIKYKQLRAKVYVRTPIIYLFINLIFQKNTVWMTLIYERWFFFIYKIILSLYKDDYHLARAAVLNRKSNRRPESNQHFSLITNLTSVFSITCFLIVSSSNSLNKPDQLHCSII